MNNPAKVSTNRRGPSRDLALSATSRERSPREIVDDATMVGQYDRLVDDLEI